MSFKGLKTLTLLSFLFSTPLFADCPNCGVNSSAPAAQMIKLSDGSGEISVEDWKDSLCEALGNSCKTLPNNYYAWDLLLADYYNTKNPGSIKVKRNDFSRGELYKEYFRGEGRSYKCQSKLSAGFCPNSNNRNPIECQIYVSCENSFEFLVTKLGFKGDILNIPSPIDGKTYLDYAESLLQLQYSDSTKERIKKIIQILKDNGGLRASEIKK